MASTKLVIISEAKALRSGSFPSASGDELNRCPTKTELTSNGFTIDTSTRTYENDQCVVGSDLGGYNISYEITNASLHYSSGSYISAAAPDTSFAYITGTVTKKQGSTTIWSSALTLSAQHTSSESYMFVSAATYIKASNRADVTGGTREGRFRGYYDSPEGDRVVTSDFTVTQQGNERTDHYITTDVKNLMLLPSDTSSHVYSSTYISYLYGTYHIIGHVYYDHWGSYTSGYNTGHNSGDTLETAYTYTNLGSWLYLNNQNTKQFKSYENTGTSNRTQTIIARFTAGTDTTSTDRTFTITQYRKPYNTYEYRINNSGITQDTWPYNVSGTSVCATFTAECQYRTTTWSDGSTSTSGTWIDYNPNNAPTEVFNNRPILINPQSHFNFYLYNGSTSTANMVDMYYPDAYTNYGSMRIYPASTNSNIAAITNTMTLSFGSGTSSATAQFTLTHNGTIAFDITPSALTFTSSAQSKEVTALTDTLSWTVETTSDWITLSRNVNIVTVGVSANESTTSDRTGTVRFLSGTTVLKTCQVTQSKAPAPEIPGVHKLYELGDGWIVGYYVHSISSATTESPSNNVHQLIIVRSDEGIKTKFNFDATGYYESHRKIYQEDEQGNLTQQIIVVTEQHNWLSVPLVQYGITYNTGTVFQAHAVDTDTNINCYGFSISGAIGYQLTTNSPQAKITFEYV